MTDDLAQKAFIGAFASIVTTGLQDAEIIAVANESFHAASAWMDRFESFNRTQENDAEAED